MTLVKDGFSEYRCEPSEKTCKTGPGPSISIAWPFAINLECDRIPDQRMSLGGVAVLGAFAVTLTEAT